jgi:ribokinase
MRRVHVLGNAGLDITLSLPHLPVDGETLIADRAERAPGGKGLNQAVVAARAGATVRFQANLGNDPDAEMVQRALAVEPIGQLLLPRVQLQTDLSVVMVDPQGRNTIASVGLCADAITETLAIAFATEIAPGEVLLMQCNMSHDATLAAARCAAQRGATVLLNTAPLRWNISDIVPFCSIVIANEIEAAASKLGDTGDAVTIVTLGARGAVVTDRTGARHQPARPVPVVDTTGAGDTFCGVLAAALSQAIPLDTSIELAQQAAAITVTRHGAFAALPTAQELQQLFFSHRSAAP